ncbi:carboxymuconolactone decarboxylase family protein [Gordonia neofelifaecis]|uniref:carboxymuconolactone decarboxylase family protein n=1 Tax=Gordonia neofelifaecis TaxID=945692 RepID=UPI00068272EF|nr:carboxymuconolactone decarboxylase family protein [Gordonia neofelifaecis]
MTVTERLDDWSGLHADEALLRYAPEAVRGLESLVALAPSLVGGDLTELVRTVCADTLGLDALPSPRGRQQRDTSGAVDELLTEFAGQFTVDVSVIDDAARRDVVAAFGTDLGAVMAMIYVADWTPRTRRALDRLFGAPVDGWPVPDRWDDSAVDAWDRVDAFMRSVARLREVDPVTTELVRLREARQHNCRICKSLRSRSALTAGVDESTFDEIDHYEDSTLDPRQRAALALADAMIWQPGHIDDAVFDDVRAHFSPAEAVELVLDLMRNASSKIAVATGADQANVAEGVEIYDVRSDGTVEFGLSAPVG